MREPNRHSNPSVATLLDDVFGGGPKLSATARKRIWNQALVLSQAPQPQSGWRFSRAVLYPVFTLLVVLGFLGGYVGVVVAAGPSVPGEVFYPIERKAERVWLSLTPDAQRCEVQLVLLERRVYEIKALLEAGKPVPQSIIQETELLFLGIVEAAACYGHQDYLLRHLTTYQHQVKALRERYPGIWGLANLLEAANSVVVELGGDPVQARPQMLSHTSI